MPFTISHAAAVLPLRRSGASRLPLAALMIGAMSPDFAYFLPADLDRASSHSLEGIFQFCLPVGLALWLLFAHVLERPTLEMLPAAWRARVPRSDRSGSLRNLSFAALAVVLGALTHIAWDAFTHAGTPVSNAFPILNTRVFSVGGMTFRLHLVLQYLSSIVGLVALAWWAWNLRRAPIVAPAEEHRSRLSDRARVAGLLLVVGASAAQAGVGYLTNLDDPFQTRIFHFLIGGMTGCALAWLALALWIRARD